MEQLLRDRRAPAVAAISVFLLAVVVAYLTFGQALITKQLRGGYIVTYLCVAVLVYFCFRMWQRIEEQNAIIRQIRNDHARVAALPDPDELRRLMDKLNRLFWRNELEGAVSKTDALPDPDELRRLMDKLNRLPWRDEYDAHSH